MRGGRGRGAMTQIVRRGARREPTGQTLMKCRGIEAERGNCRLPHGLRSAWAGRLCAMVDRADESEDAAPERWGRAAHVTSPYATGSGGGTLEARIATSYLADMLLGYSRSETGDLPVVRVAFQTNPDPVDDLRVVGERDGRRVVAPCLGPPQAELRQERREDDQARCGPAGPDRPVRRGRRTRSWWSPSPG